MYYGFTRNPVYLDMGFETLNLKFRELRLRELTALDVVPNRSHSQSQKLLPGGGGV